MSPARTVRRSWSGRAPGSALLGALILRRALARPMSPARAVRRSWSGRAPGSALLGAVLMVALAGAAAAALAELGRIAVVRSGLDRDGVRAWFLAEAGLADAMAAIEPGTDFTAWLERETPAAGGAGPWRYTASFRDDTDESPDDPTTDANRQVLLRVTAEGPAPVRRRLEATIGRELEPFFPGAATLAGGVRELTGDLLLDGRDGSLESECTMAGGGRERAGLAMPEGASLPWLDHPERVTGSGSTPSLVRVAAPDLTPLVDAEGAIRLAPGALVGILGSAAAPQLAVVTGDAAVDGPLTGGGVLFVSGRLRVSGSLTFTGVVAAAGGVELAPGGTLAVCGALWAGGEPALYARGRGTVRASADAIRRAATVAPLPARPLVLAARELF